MPDVVYEYVMVGNSPPVTKFTEASADVFEPLRSASDQLADVSSQAEMDQILGTFDTDPRFERFDKACLDLQAIADENSIAVDLNCELE